MRLYLDQMLQADLAAILRTDGHDVVRASDTGQATADDSEILAHAVASNRILVTLDEHFGDWAILPLSRHPGVVRLKINPTTTDRAESLLLPFLRSHSERQLANHLVILSARSTRWIGTSR